MKKKVELGTVLYLMAYVLWLSIALIRYTYFKDYLPTEDISRVLFCTAQTLLLYKLILEFEFNWKQMLGLFFLLLFMTIAWAGGRLQFATMFALVYSAKNVPFDKILKTALISQVCLVVVTVSASQVGVLDDYMWVDYARQRHGLGFTHCMLASHFGLFISLIYVALKKRITIVNAMLIIGGNYILYRYTIGRTDMGLSVLFVLFAFIFGNIGKRLKWEKLLGVVSATIPLVLCAVSIVACKIFNIDNELWYKFNFLLNDRLWLAQNAVLEYGFPLFGHKIKWVGMSNLYYNPELVYNYVDNSYLMMIFTYGTVFVFLYCVATGWVLYKLFCQKETMLITCVLITLAFGVVNPQSMYLTYNPFLLLLATFWNPSEKKVNVGERKIS